MSEHRNLSLHLQQNMKRIHTTTITKHLGTRKINRLMQASSVNTPYASPAQLRTNTSPFLLAYLHKVDASHTPPPLLCNTQKIHDATYLFICGHLPPRTDIPGLWTTQVVMLLYLAKLKNVKYSTT